jgi:GNAT superfamily N-acetyltransferase
MEISAATPDDIPQLSELLSLLFDQEAEFKPDEASQQRGLEMILLEPSLGRILVARQDDRIVGMANLLFTVSTALGGRVGILEDLVVRKEYRGQGIGTHLLTASLAFARESGCLRVTLLTDHDNESAIRFYLRHQFEASSMVPLRVHFAP